MEVGRSLASSGGEHRLSSTAYSPTSDGHALPAKMPLSWLLNSRSKGSELFRQGKAL